jgi:adenylate cyclase
MVCTEPLPLDLDGLVERIIERGLQGQPIEEQLAGLAEPIYDAGFPMKRVSIGMRTLHPRFGALTYIWRLDEDRVEYSSQERTVQELTAFQQSPIHFMLTTGETIQRQRLDSDEKLAFPVLEELRGEGMTDYAARLVRYDAASQGSSALEGVFFSCATDNPAGFHAGQLQQVLELLPYFAIAIKSRLTYDVASTVTETYLGKDAGRRVLTGEIERGSTQTIKAVIWYFDLQGFTKLAETTPGDRMIAMLNDYSGLSTIRGFQFFLFCIEL